MINNYCNLPTIFIRSEGNDKFSSLHHGNESTDKFKTLTKKPFVFDNFGRAHLSTPHSGTVDVYIRAQKFNSTTAATHITDLAPVISRHIEAGKTVIQVLSDNGPDFNPKSLLNIIFYYRLFRDKKLDFLSVLTYAARYSAYNPVEHVWSPLSNKLAGVILSSCLQGEDKPPAQQSKLSKEELDEKEQKLFDIAMSDLATHWKDTTFDSFPVNVKVVECSKDDLLYDDYDTVKNFLKSPIRDAHLYSDLNKEYKAMFSHMTRYSNEVVFQKCSNRQCCEEWEATEVKSFLKKHEMKLFSPINSSSLSGHYETFLNLAIRENQAGVKYSDEGQPSRVRQGLNKCEFCPSFVIFSKTEKQRHKSLFHRRQKEKAPKPQNFPCEVCDQVFTSASSLSRHKTANGHTIKAMKRKAATDPIEPPKKKKSTTNDTPNRRPKRTINDFLRLNDANNDEEFDDEVELEVHYSEDNENEMVHSEDDDDEIIVEDKEERPEEFTVGMFVIVEYEGELFPGEILKLVRDGVSVSCMKKCQSSGSTWMWPSKADLHDYPYCDVKFKDVTLNELPGTSRRKEYHIAELEHIWGGQENI